MSTMRYRGEKVLGDATIIMTIGALVIHGGSGFRYQWSVIPVHELVSA